MGCRREGCRREGGTEVEEEGSFWEVSNGANFVIWRMVVSANKLIEPDSRASRSREVP